MPRSAEFKNTLALLSDYVKDIGDEVEEEFVEELLAIEVRGDEKWLTGHRCRQDSEIYLIAGHEEMRSMGTVYFLSAIDNIARQLEKDAAEAILQSSEFEGLDELEDDHERNRAASKILLENVDSNEMAALENYLYMMVSGGDHETQLYHTDSGAVRGFNTSTMFFPFERSFGIDEFYDSVQSAVQAGIRGNRLLGRTIFVDVDDSNPAESNLDLHFGW